MLPGGEMLCLNARLKEFPGEKPPDGVDQVLPVRP
jgi:hypothetical protein